MLDIGRISVRGSIEAHSSIYRRHQRSARTKPALLCLVPEHGRADSGWRWRTVLADSDGLAIAPQDTIHLPDHGTSPQCMFNAKPEIMAMRSLLSAVQLRSCATIIRLRSSNLLHYMRHRLCIRPSMSQDMAPKSNACKLSIWRCLNVASMIRPLLQLRCWLAPSALEAWQRHHLVLRSKTIAT